MGVRREIGVAASGVSTIGAMLVEALEVLPDQHRSIIDHPDAHSAFHASLIVRQAVEIAKQLDEWARSTEEGIE